MFEAATDIPNAPDSELSLDEAMTIILMVASQGDAKAQFHMGCCYELGTVVKKNLDQAFDWFQKAALQGHADAQNRVGTFYLDSKGNVKRDVAKAFEYFQLAANQGLAVAEYNLGAYYQTRGPESDRDVMKAFEWYQKAAAKGEPSAQSCLGVYYHSATGTVEKNEKLAVKWFQKAAQQGSSHGEYNLAVCYANGKGIEQDFSKALQCFEQAALHGNPDAQTTLGCSYYFGHNGLDVDFKQAVHWFEKAAQLNHPLAQCNLAACYLKGKGVPQDETLALQWFRKSAAQGNDGAIHSFNQYFNQLRTSIPQALPAATACKQLFNALQNKQSVDPQRLHYAFAEDASILATAYHIVMAFADTKTLDHLLREHPKPIRALFIEDNLKILQPDHMAYEWLICGEKDFQLWKEKTKLFNNLVAALQAAPEPNLSLLDLLRDKTPKWLGPTTANDTQRSYAALQTPAEKSTPVSQNYKKPGV